MQALQLKPRTKQMKLITSVVTGVILSLLPIPALAQLSFTPNATPPPNSGATAGGGFNDSGRSLTPQTNLSPVQGGGSLANPTGPGLLGRPNATPGSPRGPANSGTFDPYAMNGQLTVPPVGSAPYVGANPSGYATPQTLPNGGSNPFGFNPATPQTGNAATSTMGAPTGIGGNPTNMNSPSSTPRNQGGLFGLFSLPAASTAAYGNGTSFDNPSVYGPQGSAASPTVNNQNPYGPSSYPSNIYPQNSPNSLFPDGLGSAYPGGLLQNPSTSYNNSRRLQGLRFRYTYVSPGSKPQHLGINDFDSSVAFAFPNFLNLNQPLYIVPSFSLHLWDGPDGVSTAADLPSKAFDAFVDLGWESDPNQMVSTDLGLRLGVFTDFDTYTDRSFRVRGRALLNFRLTPVTSFKGGVYYVNRDEIKLIPAAGLLYRPDPYTRIDLYFPKPKYSKYYRTLGTQDVWWYVTGDYGGGNWTITRDNGIEESIDINDLRAVLGMEWGPSNALAIGRRSGFLEIGYVFNREVLYRTQQADNFDPDDAFMFRIGIGY